MNTEKLGQEPAFPISEEQMDRIEKYPQIAKMAGISKRLYIATAAMQGILSNFSHLNIDNKKASLSDEHIEVYVSASYSIADEMLKQENETHGDSK